MNNPIPPNPITEAHATSHEYASGVAAMKTLYDAVTAEVAKLFVGQDELVLGTMTALFSGGHLLIESVPGLGKTLFVRLNVRLTHLKT